MEKDNKTAVLKSIKMQLVSLNGNFDEEWYMPLLTFYGEKKITLKINLYIRGENRVKISDCRNELCKFVGSQIDALQNEIIEICEKYNEWEKPIIEQPLFDKHEFDKQLAIELSKYIKERKTQEECTGFIAGFEKAYKIFKA